MDLEDCILTCGVHLFQCPRCWHWWCIWRIVLWLWCSPVSVPEVLVMMVYLEDCIVTMMFTCFSAPGVGHDGGPGGGRWLGFPGWSGGWGPWQVKWPTQLGVQSFHFPSFQGSGKPASLFVFNLKKKKFWQVRPSDRQWSILKWETVTILFFELGRVKEQVTDARHWVHLSVEHFLVQSLVAPSASVHVFLLEKLMTYWLHFWGELFQIQFIQFPVIQARFVWVIQPAWVHCFVKVQFSVKESIKVHFSIIELARVHYFVSVHFFVIQSANARFCYSHCERVT